MPISKRDKKVSLTKTSKKGMAMKQQIVENIKTFLDKYDKLFVFTTNNMRNGPLKDLREEWKDSRFFFAKRKVMALALGRTEAEEIQKNIHKIASHLVGQCGLLFTNRPKDQVVEWFRDYSQMEFAKSGFVATENVTLPAGPLPFSFSLEPHLRSLGLPTQLNKGTIVLREDYTVCTEGSKLTPEQASILKLFGKKMAEFKIKIACMWSKDGAFERFKIPKAAKQLTPQDNKLQKKKKTTSGSEQEDEKAEEEITQLFDQQTINEDDMKDVKEEESIVTNHANEKSTLSQSGEDELMVDESEKTIKTEEEEESKEAVQEEMKENTNENKANRKQILNDNLSKCEESEESENKKISKRKSQRTTQATSQEEVPKEEVGELSTSDELKSIYESPKITKVAPRRSMRTPKPIRRSPEGKKESVKKLTESSKKTRSVVKDKVTRPARSTPRKSVSKKIFEEPADVEMAE